jgi:FtsZ-binding cell division protein ZapB
MVRQRLIMKYENKLQSQLQTINIAQMEREEILTKYGFISDKNESLDKSLRV